jgi:protease I
VQRFVKEFDAAKKPMFAIGHGAHVLISAQVSRGRTMTGSPSISDDIRNAGGLFRDQPTVQDGHWITTRGVGDIVMFNRAMLEKLSSAVSTAV